MTIHCFPRLSRDVCHPRYSRRSYSTLATRHISTFLVKSCHLFMLVSRFSHTLLHCTYRTHRLISACAYFKTARKYVRNTQYTFNSEGKNWPHLHWPKDLDLWHQTPSQVSWVGSRHETILHVSLVFWWEEFPVLSIPLLPLILKKLLLINFWLSRCLP